ACVLALVMMPVMAEIFVGTDGAPPPTLRGVAMTVFWTMLKVAAFVAVMLVVGRRLIPLVLERIAGTGSRELFTLSVLAIALGIAFGSALLFGVSFALGAFFAGMLLNESELSHKAANDSLPLRDAFAVLFFVSVGMLFDPMILVQRPLEVAATTLIILVGKSAAAFFIVRAFGHPNSTALTISASLAQIGEFAFIIAGLGVTLGMLSVDEQSLVLAGALISIMLNPMIFRLLDRRLARKAAEAAAAEAAVEAATHEDEVEHPPLDVDNHTIVVGYGRVGRQLALLLRDRGVPVVVVEEEADLTQRAREEGLLTVRGNVASEPVMCEALPERAKLAVFAIPRALEAGETIERMKKLNPALTVLARAHSEAEVRHLLQHGADGAVLAERELAFSLAEMVMATPPYRPVRKPAGDDAAPPSDPAPAAA